MDPGTFRDLPIYEIIFRDLQNCRRRRNTFRDLPIYEIIFRDLQKLPSPPEHFPRFTHIWAFRDIFRDFKGGAIYR